MAKRTELRSAGDPDIVGKRVYDPVSGELIGIPQLITPDGDSFIVIVKIPGQDNPVHLRLTRVLAEVRQAPPTVSNYDEPPAPNAQELDWRDKSGHPASTPEREKVQFRAEQEGASWEDSHREEGVGDGEHALPREDEPDPDPQDRPGGKHRVKDVTLYPEGKPLGRTKDDDTHRSGGLTGGGTNMTVADVKAAIDAAIQNLNDAMGAAHVAASKAEELAQMAQNAVSEAEQAAATAHSAIEEAVKAQHSFAVATDGAANDAVATALAAAQAGSEKFSEGASSIALFKQKLDEGGAVIGTVKETMDEGIQSLQNAIETAQGYSSLL